MSGPADRRDRPIRADYQEVVFEEIDRRWPGVAKMLTSAPIGALVVLGFVLFWLVVALVVCGWVRQALGNGQRLQGVEVEGRTRRLRVSFQSDRLLGSDENKEEEAAVVDRVALPKSGIEHRE